MWQQWGDLAGCLVTELPRPPADAEPTSDRRRRLAALISAYHADSGPVAVCWHRPTGSGPVQIHVAGSGLVSADPYPRQTARLSLPVGGSGRRTPPGALAETLGRVASWAPIRVVSDPLAVEESERRTGGSGAAAAVARGLPAGDLAGAVHLAGAGRAGGRRGAGGGDRRDRQ